MTDRTPQSNDDGALERLRYEVEKLGLNVHVAEDADLAMEILNKTEIDLLVVDVVLPSEKNGFDIAEAARRSYPDTAVVIITGNGTEEHLRRSEAVGAMDYLEKPFELGTFRRCLREFQRQKNILRELHELEQELAGRSEACVRFRGLLESWPVIWISEEGHILYATSSGRAALNLLVAPKVPRPIVQVDEDFLRRVRSVLGSSVSDEGGSRQVTLFRCDGVAAHMTGYVRRTIIRDRTGLTILFRDEDSPEEDGLDPLWTKLMLGAVRSVGE